MCKKGVVFVFSIAKENFHATQGKRGYIMAPWGITFLRLVMEKIEGKCHSYQEQKNLQFSNFAYKRLMSLIFF